MNIIKKIAAIILAAVLCLGGSALAEETPGVTPEDSLDEWVDLDGTYDAEKDDWADDEETAQPEILAVYSSPETQIITNDDQSKVLADTVIFLYQDHSYVQYVDHESQYEIYTKGTFQVNFDWTEPDWQDKTPHILTIHAEHKRIRNNLLSSKTEFFTDPP